MVAAALAEPTKKWPLLREDLSLFPGPRGSNGTPTWTLYDPAMHRYFRLGWLEFECLQRWLLSDATAIAESIANDTPIHATAADVEGVVEFLINQQLTVAKTAEATAILLKKRQAGKQRFWTSLLHNYLFFRIPLVRPDALLRKIVPYARVVFHPIFLMLLAFSTLLAIYLVAEQWTAFSHSFLYMFTTEGMIATAAMLSLSKIAHESGHALAASHFGCRVPTMGIAFVLGFPMLWTDVTDAWRLPDRKQRLLIDAAGMLAELVVAVLATLVWSVLPDGALRTGVYLLASSAWLITLAINLNPFMRFDGYYLLSDYLDIANLQDRAFALARWRLRESLFAFHLPPPELWQGFKRRALLAYAYGTWIYRFFLFAGIAWAVYQFFFKALGLALFIVEIGWFIAKPFVKEIGTWRDLFKNLKISLRPRPAWLIPIAIVGLLFIPWRSHVLLPGLLHADAEYTLYSAEPAQVKQVYVTEGQTVQPKQILAELYSPDLEFKKASAERKLTELTAQLSAQSVERDLAWRNPMDLEALQSVLAELDGLKDAQQKLILRATFAGKVRDLAEVLQPGEWLAKDEPLGVVEAAKATVVAYGEEADLRLLQIGAQGRFYPEGGDLSVFSVKIISIDQTGTRQLNRPELASVYGGEIAVREDEEKNLVPEQGIYRVVLEADTTGLKHTISLRGRLALETPAESLMTRVFRFTAAALIRESAW